MLQIFILWISMSQSQVLMLDSRQDQFKQLNLNLFHQQFSIWFTYFMTSDPQYVNLFYIINRNYSIAKVQVSPFQIRVLYNQDQIMEIENQQIQNNRWVHLIINQNENFKKNEFSLKTAQNQTTEYGFLVNSTLILDNQSYISIEFSYFQFCLIHDRYIQEIDPIIKQYNMQLLINRQVRTIFVYHSDSSIEFFMKKHSRKFKISSMINIFQQDQNLISISEVNNVFIIQINSEQKFFKSSSSLLSWFRIFIKFEKQNLQYEIQFKDEFFQESLKAENYPKIFYKVLLNTDQQNYQFMKFTSYFKVKNYEIIDNQVLKQFQNCGRNIRYYLDIESNSCKDFLELDQILNLEPKIFDVIQRKSEETFQLKQIGEAISRSILSNITNQDMYPLLESYRDEAQNFMKEPFFLWRYQQQVYCQQSYFGFQCNKFIKKCKNALDDHCKKCSDGFLLIRKKCVRCPLNCLFCTLEQKQYKCLIPKIGFFVNKNYFAKLCKCQLCNIKGECADSEQVISLIQKCLDDEECFLDYCINSYSYYSLESNQCFQLTFDHFQQSRYYLYYQDKTYQYSLLDIQFILLQNIQIYGNTLMNEMVSNYYLNIQLDYGLQKFYESNFDFDDEEYFYQSHFNLECIKRHINEKGTVTCKEYMNIQNKKCNKLTCLYRLIINNIMYYIGAQSYLVYDNQQYISVIDLLQSVTFIGIKFYSVCLEITFIPQNTDDGILGFEVINLQNRTKIPQFASTLIEFDIKFSQWQNFPLELNILVDKVIIQNQIINNIDMSITALKIEIFDVSLTDHIICQFDSGEYLIMEKIKAQNNFTIFVKYIHNVVINDFQITNSSNFRFSFQRINQLTLKNFQLSTQQLNKQLYSYFFTVNVSQITISQFKMEFKYCLNINFIEASFGLQIHIMDINIIGQTLFSSQLFILDHYNFTNINNYSCQINNIQKSHVFSLIEMIQLQINQLQQISDLIQNSTLLFLESELIILQEIKIQSLIDPYDSLIFAISIHLKINNLHLNQTIDKNMLVDVTRKGFLIQLSQGKAVISNLHLNGINLKDFGLIFLESTIESQIQNLSITNIKLQVTIEGQIVLIKDQISHIENLIMRKIWIDNQIQTVLNIIDVQNYNYILITNSSISEILQVQHMTRAYIFYLQSLIGKLMIINSTRCDNIDLIFVKSVHFSIFKLNSYNNSNQYIVAMNDFKVKLFQIINSNISLEKNQFAIFVKTFQKAMIILKNIKINIQEVDSYYFNFYGDLLTVQMTNIFIDQHSIYPNSKYPQSIFDIINTADLYVRNLAVKNLCQQLFYIFKAQQVFIYNVILKNTDIKYGQFIFQIQSSPLILYNIRFISIRQCQGIFDIFLDVQNLVYIHNIYVKNVRNVDKIFQIKSNFTNMQFKNIYIWNARDGHIFDLDIEGQQKIMIEDLQLYYANQFVIQQRGQCSLEIKKSILKIQNFNSQNANLDLKFIGSEIILNQQLLFQQIQFDRSYIFNNMGSSIKYELKIIATLSLNRVSHLKSIRLDSDQVDCKRFLVTQNGSLNFSFYVPSGQKLSEYKKLNFKSLLLEQIYQGLFLVVQGFNNRNTIQCTQQQIYNDKLLNQQNLIGYAIEEGIYDLNEQVFTLSPLNSNYTVFKLICQSDNGNQRVELQYNVKSFPCQLGEYLFQNQCLECKISLNQYSVNWNSNKCNYIDHNQIKEIRKGLLELNPSYWRYSFTSNVIEQCDSNYCNGGWVPGEKSCIKSRIGALCQECDIYNVRGDGSYTKSNQQCLQCESINFQLILKLLFTVLWQLLLVINGYYSNKKLSEQYLMFRVGFRQYYQILYRQSIDLPSLIIKMFTNYLFMLYIIRTNLNITGYSFINNINLINNPSLITKAQMDCILSKNFEIDIIYSQFIFQIVLLFFIISLSYTIYLIIIKIKKIKFHLGLILSITEGIIVYNLNIILVISFNLLSYKVASGVKWVQYNMQYLFYTNKHLGMIQMIAPITFIFLFSPLLFPVAIKYLSAFNRQVTRIYAIYHQQYKPLYTFWEYLILYVKYAIIILQILDQSLNYYGILTIWFICVLNSNFKPYYLQNLNIFEQNLYFFYGIQLTLLQMNNFKDEIIICLNILIFTYFERNVEFSLNTFNLRNVIQMKVKIVSKFNWVRGFSGLAKNQRQLKNKLSLIYLVKTQILKKQFASTTTNQVILNTEQEVEMPMIFKQIQPKIPQSRR